MPELKALSVPAGGVLGGGAAWTVREYLDVKNGSVNNLAGQPGTILGRLTRPSVLYGLGSAAVMGAWQYFGSNSPIRPRSGFGTLRLWWAASGFAGGIASLLVPKQPAGSGGGSSQTFRSAVGRGSPSGTSSSANGSGTLSDPSLEMADQ